MDFFSLCGPRLVEERKRLGLSQEMLGSVCGVSREMWGKYERGKAAPGAEVLAAFTEAGGDVLYVLTGMKSDQTAKSTQEGSVLRAFRLLEPKTKTDLARLMITLAGPAYYEQGHKPAAGPDDA